MIGGTPPSRPRRIFAVGVDHLRRHRLRRLVNERAGDAANFPEEDPRQGARVLHEIEFAAAAIGDSREKRHVGVAADGDGGDRDLRLPHAIDELVELRIGSLTVGEDDHVLHGRLGLLQILESLDHARVHVGPAGGGDRVDPPSDGAVVADLSQRDRFRGERVERRHRNVVTLPHRADGGDRGSLAHRELFAIHRAGTVDHDRERSDGDDLGVLDLEVDRHRLLEFGVCPAADAVRIGTADHDQAAAELTGIANEHFDLLVAEAGSAVGVAYRTARDVREDDGVVALELRQRVEEVVGCGDFYLEVLRAEPFDEEIKLPLGVGVLDEEDASLTADVSEGRGDVVLSHAVGGGIRRDEAGFVGVEVRLVDLLLDRENLLAGRNRHLFLGDRFFALARLADDDELAGDGVAGSLGSVVAEDDAQVERLAAADVRGKVDFLD